MLPHKTTEKSSKSLINPCSSVEIDPAVCYNMEYSGIFLFPGLE